jgi:hypothetical protein
MQTAVSDTRSAGQTQSAQGVPWYLWVSAAAITSAMIGAHWDISWHRSIGRDTFLSPPHLAIYLCGVLAGLCCGYLIFATTFSKTALRDHSVRVLGFRAPLGAFIVAWGGVAMLTSAPFDNWWHDAYGLDVKILSPPHVVLALGIFAIGFGSLLLTLSHLNRVGEGGRRTALALFLYISAMLVIARAVLTLEFTGRVWMHSVVFYRSAAIIFPFALASTFRATGYRWSGTVVASSYTAFLLGLQWILPLFAAEPKLGPVMREVTYFIPNGFPLLALFPAIALDLLWHRFPQWNDGLRSIVSGALFLFGFLAVQWPFANLLNSPAAYNWFFGSHHFDFYTTSQSYTVLNRFVLPEKTMAEFWSGMAGVLLLTILVTRLGFYVGSWMKRVVR